MADKPGQVSVPLPPGMAQDEFLKLFKTFQNARIVGKQKDTAFRATLAKMKDLHAAEWDRIYAEEYTKAGGV